MIRQDFRMIFTAIEAKEDRVTAPARIPLVLQNNSRQLWWEPRSRPRDGEALTFAAYRPAKSEITCSQPLTSNPIGPGADW